MADKIRIMIVDDNLATRDNIRKLLELEPDIDVSCEAASGEEAVRKAKVMVPDIILMDINMPGMDGIAATEMISNEMAECMIIVVSVQGEQEYLRRAMAAGAKDYMVKPFEGDDLLGCIRRIYAREQKRREKFVQLPARAPALGKVLSIFSTKGGIGKTTIATNLAAALGMDKNCRICIVDLDLQFGDVALFLNIAPKVTIADLVKDIENIDGSLIEKYMITYQDNVKVLAAPVRPEQAEGVLASHLTSIIKELKYNYDYILVDTAPAFNDVVFNILDSSDLIIVATSQDLPTLKNVKLCLEILESLNYSSEKIKVVLNRANSIGGMTIKDSEDLLRRKFLSLLPSDGKTVVTAVNQGVPFIIAYPDTQISQAVIKLANYIVSRDGGMEATDVKRHAVADKGLFGKAAGLFSSDTRNTDDSRKKRLKDDGKEVDSSIWSLS